MKHEDKTDLRNLDDDLDALFKLPLTEFTSARNALASRLKKAGHGVEAERVKQLGKPSVSAWAVNQLYYRHRQEFDALVAAGFQVAEGHAAQLAGKAADLRELTNARRQALSLLLRLAESILQESGHAPSSDTMRRISTTLEALSTTASADPRPGRLTEDVAPLGFESLSTLMPNLKVSPTPPSNVLPFKAPVDSSKAEAAKAALRAAERELDEKHAVLERVVDQLKDAKEQSAKLESARHEAQLRLNEAIEAAREARLAEQNLVAEAKAAERALKDAAREVERLRSKMSL
jgi:hypothetical protein